MFLNLRNLHCVLQYRPSIDSVIWYQQGPWSNPHDVDILNDSTIILLNNNISLGKGSDHLSKKLIEKVYERRKNLIIKYNYSTNKMSSFFDSSVSNQLLSTDFKGCQQIDLKNNFAYVESTGNRVFYFVNTKTQKVYPFYHPDPKDSTKGREIYWARTYNLE